MRTRRHFEVDRNPRLRHAGVEPRGVDRVRLSHLARGGGRTERQRLIGALVRSARCDDAHVEVTQAGAGGHFLELDSGGAKRLVLERQVRESKARQLGRSGKRRPESNHGEHAALRYDGHRPSAHLRTRRGALEQELRAVEEHPELVTHHAVAGLVRHVEHDLGALVGGERHVVKTEDDVGREALCGRQRREECDEGPLLPVFAHDESTTSASGRGSKVFLF